MPLLADDEQVQTFLSGQTDELSCDAPVPEHESDTGHIRTGEVFVEAFGELFEESFALVALRVAGLLPVPLPVDAINHVHQDRLGTMGPSQPDRLGEDVPVCVSGLERYADALELTRLSGGLGGDLSRANARHHVLGRLARSGEM